MEIELKLLLPEHAATALAQHPILRSADAEIREEHTTYFDTPQQSLARQGLSLRIRRRGTDHVQTLKSSPVDRMVASSRPEWEWPVDQDAPDLARLMETPFGAEIVIEEASALQPVFTTEIHRTVRNLRLFDESLIEVAIDEGRIVAGEKTEEVSEFELELKQGPPGQLYRLALDLHATVPFVIGTETKSQRGYRLSTGKLPEPEKGQSPALDGDHPAVAALERMIGSDFSHILANHPAACMGNIEGVHQMRVGIRRLRTALSLFGKHLEPTALEHFEAELKRFGQVLGAARDWDVFCTELLPRAHEAKLAWAAPLRTAAAVERVKAHHALEEELRRPALTRLVLALTVWVEPYEAQAPPAGDDWLQGSLRKRAPAMLDRMRKRVAKRGRNPDRLSPEALHGLRKSLKKLRYSVDDLAALYPPKPVKHYRQACKRVLKVLGAINDAAMAHVLADRLRAGAPAELAPAISGCAAWSDRRREKAVGKLPGEWAEFAAAKPFWD